MVDRAAHRLCGAHGLCVFYAFSVLLLAEVYAFLFMMPLLITLLAVPVLGARVGWRRGIAVLVGLGGADWCDRLWRNRWK